MKKSVLILIIAMLLLTFGCGKNNIQGAAVADFDSTLDPAKQREMIEDAETKNAGEMIDLLEDSMEINPEVKTGTFYGEGEVEGEGKDALKAKTRALFEKNFFNLNVKADTKFGPRYY